MKNTIPVKYNNEIIGYSDDGGINIVYTNPNVFKHIKNQPIFVSSRQLGTIGENGKVVDIKNITVNKNNKY